MKFIEYEPTVLKPTLVPFYYMYSVGKVEKIRPLEGGRERERGSRETALRIQTSEELNIFFLLKEVNLLKYMAN